MLAWQTTAQMLKVYIKKKAVFPVLSTWSLQSMLWRMDYMSDSDPLGICHNEISYLDEY